MGPNRVRSADRGWQMKTFMSVRVVGMALLLTSLTATGVLVAPTPSGASSSSVPTTTFGTLASPCGKGHATGEKFGLGVFGTLSNATANETILAADCIVAFGASLTQWTTKKGKLIAPNAVVAQVDLEQH